MRPRWVVRVRSAGGWVACEARFDVAREERMVGRRGRRGSVFIFVVRV